MEDPAEKAGMRNAFGRVAVEYDELWARQTAGYTERGLDLLDPDPAAAGLDMACGPGWTALLLAERLSAGTVLGVDFAPGMVARAEELTDGRPELAFAVDDAEHLSLPDESFDVVTCSLGVMYCYDALGALRHLARVLRPGGRLMLTVWGNAGRVWWSPAIRMVETRAEYFSATCPMMFFYGLPGVMPRMLQQVGLTLLHEERLNEPMRYEDMEEAIDAVTDGGPLAGLYHGRLTDEQREDVRAELRAHLEAVGTVDREGLSLPCEVVVTVAERPLPDG